jgi:cytochrome c-type biogenesis protein
VELGLVTLGMALLAGLLTTLNPCVLPLLPIIAGAATAKHRMSLFALAGGMVVAFTGVGVLVASGGRLLGLEAESWRFAAGAIMLGFGAVLVSTRLQALFSRWTARFGDSGNQLASRIRSDHPLPQAALGAALGVAWTPCIGPTIGAAMGLAATGEGVAQAAIVMAVFSVAAVVPLVIAGLASQAYFARNRERMARAGAIGRKIMGVGLVLIGLMVVLGLDKVVEARLLDWMPQWLLRLTTNV